MNDIEILEDIISEYKATAIEWKFENVPVHLDERDIEAIKNLIQRNKELMLDKKVFTDNYGNMILKIAELEKENKKIRQWKYVIDTYADLEKLKELDLIKIEGKEYISKDKIREIFDNYSQSSLMENNTFLEFKKELLEERN